MNSYKQLYCKYLDDLAKEISQYKNEENLWKLEGNINNTPGNLCLHICGNLNHFYGAVIGNTGYIRQRDMEFSKKNISRDELLKGVDETKSMIEKIFDGLSLEDVKKIYPDDKFGENVTTVLYFQDWFHISPIISVR